MTTTDGQPSQPDAPESHQAPQTGHGAATPAATPVPQTPATSTSGLWDWRAVPGRLAFLLTTLPFAVGAGCAVICLVAAGVPLLILGPVGAALILAGLGCARGFGMIELKRLAWTRTPFIEPTRHQPATGTAWQRIRAGLTDTDDWRAMMHAVINLALGTFTWCVTLLWLAMPLQAVWYVSAPQWLLEGGASIGDAFHQWMGGAGRLSEIPPRAIDVACGVVFLLTLPLACGILTRLHHGLAQALLSRDSQAELRRQVAALRTQRTAATAAEGESLRRLERDIHDGPQQQLLRMQMDLDSARRATGEDPERAAQMIDQVRERTQATLDELRSLSQGIVHPLLRDRGLAAAIRSIGERSTVPVSVHDSLNPAAPIPTDVQQGVFLAVSELLANVAKHSGASQAAVRLDLITGPAGGPAIQVGVSDDGRGGAHFGDGRGLDGVAQRMRALGGDMRLSSPAGGPTQVWLMVPLAQ